MTTDEFLNRGAAEVVDDANFERFPRAFERATHAPRQEVERLFGSIDGTVADALEAIFARYPQTDGPGVVLADVRRVGAEEQATIHKLEADLESLRGPLQSWYAFMDVDPD